MATKARRITIEVGGEDAGAAKALKGAGKDADKLGQKLKGAGGDAKMGFGDVEDATDKLGSKFRKIDADAKRGFGGIGDEADKLGTKLKGAGTEAGSKLKSGFESGVSGLGGAVESAGSTAADAISGGFDASTITDSMTGVLQSVGGRLGPAAAGVGVVVGGALATGIVNGMEEEASTDRLAAQVGGGDWGETAGRIAGDLYRDAFGDSIDDVGVTVRAVMTSNLAPMGANEDKLFDIAEAAATFSDVMEQDATQSVAAVDRMIANNLVPDAEFGFDILTTGLQELGPAGEDLLDTFHEYSIQFAAIGLDGEAALGAINALLNAGVRNTDIAADALKEFGIRAIDSSDATVDAFKDLGFSADDMMRKIADGGPGAVEGLNQTLGALQDIEDPVERNRLGVELFGTQWEELKGTIATADLSAGAADLGEIEGRTEGLSPAFDNASTKITEFRRKALEKLTEFVGNSVLPKLELLKSWAQDNPGAFQLIAGVIGGVLVLAFTAWAISAASAAAATIAATWPILLIGALVAGLALLVAIHFETIKGWFMSVFNWVRDNWPLLLAILTGPIGWAVLLIKTHWDTIKDAGKAVFNWVKENWPLLLGILTGPIGWAVLLITSHWDTIKSGATGVKNWITDRFDSLVSFVTGLPGRISSAASGMFDGITDAFRSAINSVINGWNNLSFTLPSITLPDIPGMPGRGSTVGGQTFSTPNIPTLDKGGLVPGPLGSPQLVLAHGGETMVPTHDAAAMRSFTSSAGAGAAAEVSAGGDTYYSFDFSGATIGSNQNEVERTIVRAINKAQAKGTTIKRRRPR